MSYSWNLPVVDFSDWLLWVSNMHLRLLLVFSRLATTFLLSADWYVTVWLCHSLSSSHWLMKAIWVASQFGNCAWSCYRHPCSDFCMDISFFFFWHKFLIHLGMYPGSQLLNCIVGICIVLQKKKKLPSYLLEWYYHFAFPPAISENFLWTLYWVNGEHYIVSGC